MKRLFIILFAILVANSFASAQILVNFEADLGGFQNNSWGTAMNTVTHVADPTSQSVGVMQLNMSFGGKPDHGAAGVSSPVSVVNGRLVTYWVYLPTGIPDGIQFGVYAQDNVHWVWNETLTNASDIPKNTWYPLSFDLAAAYAKNSNFDIVNGKLNTGLQINNYADTVTVWTGNILVDNLTLIGVKPTMVADFEATVTPYANNSWGTAMNTVTRVTDPTSKSTGVMQLNMTFGGKPDHGAAGTSAPVEMKGQKFITYWVYVPTGIPAGIQIGLYAQDNVHWVWNEKLTNVSDIPKDTWYPLTFDLEATYIKNSNFDIVNGKLNTGLQINNYADTVTVWTGNILVDNVAFLNEKVAVKWVIADFEAPAGGLYGFSAGWGTATGTPVAMADPTGLNNTRVLNVPALFAGSDGKLVIQKSGIAIKSTVDKSIASAIALDIYLPPDFPDGGQVGVFFYGSVLKSPTTWTEDLFHTYGADSLVKGKWNTIFYNVAHHDSIGDLIDTLAGTIGVQIYYSTVPNWSGNLYFDNLTMVGIPTPTGNLLSPVTTAMTDTTLVKNGNIVHFVRFDWVDNTLGSESYNLYYSKSAISNLADPSVIRFASTVSHGLQKYAHRPYTSTGVTENLYYAITATDGVTETPLRPECLVGPISIQSTPTFKIPYDANFKNTFVLDGDFGEFAPYAATQIVPETAGGDSSYDWTPSSIKLNFKVNMVIDDKYLYIAADITDIDVVTDATAQAWSGDAIEFYLGAYDIRPLQQWHGLNYQNANGDWRVGFLANGGIATEGGVTGARIPGTSTSDFVILGKLTGDGYQVEARLCLDSLAAAPHSVSVTNGMLMPFRIDCNSSMKSAIGTRILQVGVGGTPTGGRIDQDQDWKRPQGWSQLEVINGPAGVAKDDNGLPKEFKLYTNYPNPFNPATIIRYDLKQDVPVTLKVYNVLGQEVTTLVNERQKAGRYSTRFDGSRFASGMYIYQIQAGSFVKAVKMLLLK